MKKYFTFIIVFIGFVLPVFGQEFVNPLSIPPLVVNPDNYELNVTETEHNFNPFGTDSMNTMVPTFTYEDKNNPGSTTILGPTLSWSYLHNLNPKITNSLDQVTTCHWHGAHVPQAADGGPHQRILPNVTWEPSFVVDDKSATMWYHPHAMGLTYEHVQMGLSGIIIVEDPVDGLDDPILTEIHEILPTEYAVNDFPIVIQTKKFIRNDTTGQIEIQAVQGFKNDYRYMVNGIIDPYLETPASMIRLRILNGDGKFSFNLNFVDSQGNPFPAQMIATDAGYMDQSYELPDILMSPGERTEWLLDLRGLEGEEIYIHNNVSEIPAGIIGDSSTTKGYAVNRDLLKIIVTEETGPQSPIISFPIALHPLETPPLSDVSKEREKVFRQDSFFVNNKMQYLFNIDSVLMNMMVVNDVVLLDSTEIWTIDNKTNIGHPWHIHDIHFWVIKVLDSSGNELDENDYPEIFKGPKDNVLVRPGWKLSYITTFDDYGTEIAFDSSYMYHCHILPHEDRGMMGQFVVWNGEGDPPVSTEDTDLSTIEMRVFPNPSNQYFFLEGSSKGTSKIRFVDLSGRKIHEQTLPAFDGAYKIETNELPKGMLILQWNTIEGKAITKIIVE